MTEREPAILGGGEATLPAALAVERPERPRSRPRSGAETVTVVGFWRRLGAALIDLAIILPVAALLIAIASAIAGIHLPPSRNRGLDFWLDLMLVSDPAMVTALVITLAVAMIYLYVFQATIAQTLGMRVLKLRVIDVYGQRPSFARAGLRCAGYLAGLATLFLGFLWIGFDAEKRGLHDWIAGTYVIRA
jgi:uncharacterized RDD family membrane protein YckC